MNASVDVVVVIIIDNRLQVLLIRRAQTGYIKGQYLQTSGLRDNIIIYSKT